MIEKKENLPVGLTLTNPFVEQQLNAATKKKKSTILAKLNKQNMERKFLVSLVKKYPSGQAVAQRILGNVKRVTSIIKKLLVQYNEMKELPSSGYPTELRFTDVLNDESSKSHVQVESMSSLNQTTVQAYCLLQRSSEEIEIVKKDMASVLKFYEQQLAIIHSLCLNNTEIE
uniref:Uncharacterized protein n=1 Tax=Ciona savignyi TaxID=51511 RepID=H2Y4J6_CIOSA